TVAYEGRLEEAESMARLLVRDNPGYGDAAVLLARIIAWQGRYDEAINMLDSLLVAEPDHEDAINARETITGWSESAAQEERVPEEAAPVEAMNDTLAGGVDIFLGYYFDTFREPYSRFWQIFRLGAQYETSIGPLLATANFGNIQGDTDPETVKTGIQVQAEFWPKITERSYAWLAYAYSPFKYFPRHRAAAELWYNIDKGWALSGGASYYYFDRNIIIPTVSIEKYLRKYWLSARTYIHVKDVGTSESVFLSARRYFNEVDYLQITAGVGTAPDEPWDLAADLDRQKAAAFKIILNKGLGNSITIKAGAGYSREEYVNALRRNRFEGFMNIIYSPQSLVSD
ncbi:MAG TPA: hypothetical protein DEQ09_11380, partial [Bacteroidales bacterium]|nr:hypothetical protein [Bacteroidales bacterium]